MPRLSVRRTVIVFDSPIYGRAFRGNIAPGKVHGADTRGRLGWRNQDTRGNRAFWRRWHSRAPIVPREIHVQHLHQSGAHRADGDSFHDRLRGRPARACQQNLAKAIIFAANCLCESRPFFTSCGVNQWPHAGTDQRALLQWKIIGGLPLQRFYAYWKWHSCFWLPEMSRSRKLDTSECSRMIKKPPAYHQTNRAIETVHPAKRGYLVARWTCPGRPRRRVLGAQNTRTELKTFRKSAKWRLFRHFTRLSRNYAIGRGPVARWLVHQEIQSALTLNK